MGAIITSIKTLIGCIVLFIACRPILDWFTFALPGFGESPLINMALALPNWCFFLLIAVPIMSIVWVWKTVVKKISYTRNDREW